MNQEINCSLDPINLTAYPYSCVAYLRLRKRNGWSTGTGTLISERTILTVAHNEYHLTDGPTLFQEIYFGGLNSGIPQVIAPDTNFRYDSQNQWRRSIDELGFNNSRYDYGFIILDNDPLPQSNNHFGIKVSDIQDLSQFNNKELCVLGYPENDNGNLRLFGVRVNIHRRDSNFLSYSNPLLTGGCSGSPVYQLKRESNGTIGAYIVGIHIGNDPEDPTKEVARLITENMRSDIANAI